MYIYAHIHIHINALYIHTHTKIHTHIHIHTYIHKKKNVKEKLILYSNVKRNQLDRCRFYKADMDNHVTLFNGFFECCEC